MTLPWLGGCARGGLTAFEKGVEFMDYGDYPRAIEQFKTIERRDGGSLALCYNLGVCYQDMKDYDQAVFWYERALTYDPRDGDTLVNLGLVYLEQGRDLAALARLKQAADVEKDRAYPLVAMAIYHQRQGDKAKAMELYEQASKREEKSGYLWFHWATLYETMEMNQGQAAACYEKSIQYDSTNPAAFEGAARCYFRLNNWAKAIQHYDFAIHLQPDRPNLYIAAADTLVKMGRFERAVKYLWHARGLKGADSKDISRRLLDLYPKLTEEERKRYNQPTKESTAGGNDGSGQSGG
ncbi:MAG: tetratricopeptide repeat protein [Planctomycetes bacterium]|nr:tetratricopeptide repeat protein [Planctomycetota bacterium]MCW8134601.1 tetratricopeptide repeat protein [Planctomycetota bacterium]